MSSVPPADLDLTSIQWRMPEWVQAMGGLRTENVLEYFSQSPFYDRRSNNQMLKMQSQFNALDLGDMNSQLQRLQGIQFVIIHERPPDLWIIQKQNRLNPSEVKPLANYFVCNENIYMAPNAYTLLATRLLNATYCLRKALSDVKDIASFSPERGYSYPTNLSLDSELDESQQEDNLDDTVASENQETFAGDRQPNPPASEEKEEASNTPSLESAMTPSLDMSVCRALFQSIAVQNQKLAQNSQSNSST
ncbi:mediator complex subunit Pmc5 [Schizosaccharomyces japonicus yFS275]|uniref:Mediator of RNA polymerase II transcription subunit 6 n=1 Tax=Schizosaccharomyces japonicus (strain yFS275 / FY16936) TaxID=402676 RepID=B6K7J2_SCHJY|nr:mediator complex subunit Pmc5 [Schizosaccharomyces japonicus yFS275]EEB09496.1 mediator complex subunit Pmc5 [Schizosaccharomyces japonicus yFS275]